MRKFLKSNKSDQIIPAKKNNLKKMIGPKSSSAWNLESLPPKIREFIRAVKTEQAGWREELKARGSSSVV